MFELSVAFKYLIPRWRQLSVSIISIVSTLVIALVVWLIVVFFSVKDGLESSWIDKIVALTAPIRITPSEKYYHSYYYLIDSISSASNYASKSIGEKLASEQADPYDPEVDEEIPLYWNKPDKNDKSEVKDLVKLAYTASTNLNGLKNLSVNEFQTTMANLRIRLLRHGLGTKQPSQQFLEHAAYIGTFDAGTPALSKALLPLTPDDYQNLLYMQAISSDNIPYDSPDTVQYLDVKQLKPRIKAFYDTIETIPIGSFDFNKVVIKQSNHSLFAYTNENGIVMPSDNMQGEPILLPKIFKETKALIGDQGYLSYYSPTPSSVQEQRIPVYIAGFYDPGIMPMGGKYILAGKELTSLIRSSYGHDQTQISNGINVRFDNLSEAPRVKADLIKAFEEAGIAPYWHVETYQEYEFTKDLIQQLNSEKNLFSLISLIIIIVACSNIISMLIILVNDKKLEIGILRSMGATSCSIAAIFGICGMVMGAAGSLIGIAAAILTLRYVNELVGFISQVQGHDLFNPVFYGHTLPSELSMEALTFVIITTACISLLAGIVPALKASMMRPSAILRAE